ncbi:hypothetical protein ABZ921_26205 [Streptomyces atriruber]|uniref:Uncharacterized protein n=1 Tax=Streptomyces atriruber TaxID=545121 RepID=A0ABV3BSZ8_9ACTN
MRGRKNRRRGKPPTATNTSRSPARKEAWPPGTHSLLTRLLLTVADMDQLQFRKDLLRLLRQVSGADVWVVEHGRADDHVRAIVDQCLGHAHAADVLAALSAALQQLRPDDAATSWMELAVLALTDTDGGLPRAHVPDVIEAARALPEPGNEYIFACLTESMRGRMTVPVLDGPQTLVMVLVRLHEARPTHGTATQLLSGFLTLVNRGLPHGPDRRLERAVKQLCPELPPDVGLEETRLIVQVRLEPCRAENRDDPRYQILSAYYRQETRGGPLEFVDSLPDSPPFYRSELLDQGSARLKAWRKLAADARRGQIRMEFLLPKTLLGYAAELWSDSPTDIPIGPLCPVVVRSLERYYEGRVYAQWRERWATLEDHHTAEDPLGRIGWLSSGALSPGAWLTKNPDVVCLGFTVAYDNLEEHVRDALFEVLVLGGIPAAIWRRDSGDHQELLAALREHGPSSLAQLPEIVHECRKRGRGAGEANVRNRITLLWDDPTCVDPDQDRYFDPSPL